MGIVAMAASCAFAPVCSPEGPQTPFGSGWLSLFDTVRLLCAVIAVVTLVFTPKAYTMLRAPGQRARVAALTLLSLQAIITEIEHLGDYASLRLALNFAAVCFALYGILQLREEIPAQRNR